MRLDDLVLKPDRQLASKLLGCYDDQVNKSHELVSKGHLSSALMCLNEAERCIRDLSQLSLYKKIIDNIKEIKEVSKV